MKMMQEQSMAFALNDPAPTAPIHLANAARSWLVRHILFRAETRYALPLEIRYDALRQDERRKKERNNDEYDMVFRMETIAQHLDYC